jgi:serine/threonine protein kinase
MLVMCLRVNSSSGQSALYRPPESFSHSEYTKISDIYQCGLVFFQLLGGHLLSEERELLDTAGRHRIKLAKDGFERSCASMRP